jgi:hypothetical protein
MEGSLITVMMADDTIIVSLEALRNNIKLSMKDPLVSVTIAGDTSTISYKAL